MIADSNGIVWYSDENRKEYYRIVNEAAAYNIDYILINSFKTKKILENSKKELLYKNTKYKSLNMVAIFDSNEPSYIHSLCDEKGNIIYKFYGPSAQQYSNMLYTIYIQDKLQFYKNNIKNLKNKLIFGTILLFIILVLIIII